MYTGHVSTKYRKVKYKGIILDNYMITPCGRLIDSQGHLVSMFQNSRDETIATLHDFIRYDVNIKEVLIETWGEYSTNSRNIEVIHIDQNPLSIYNLMVTDDRRKYKVIPSTHNIYEITVDGHMRRCDTKAFGIRHYPSNNRYIYFKYRYRNEYIELNVAKCVLEAWQGIPLSNKYCIIFDDGDSRNIHLDNMHIKWSTNGKDIRLSTHRKVKEIDKYD